MNKLFSTTTAWVLLLVILAWGSESPARQADGLPGGAGSNPGEMQQYDSESHANDSFYLRDQIDLKLNFGPDIDFVVSARPGELIYVNRSLPGGSEQRQALVVIPIRAGVALPPRREELKNYPSADIAFRVMPYCLNALAASNGEQNPAADSCMARAREDLGADFLLPMIPLMKKEIYLNDTVVEGLTGAQLKVIKYRESGYRSFAQFNPYAKCCLEFQDFEVCSCSVLSPISSCNRGCPVSEQMKKEIGN